MKADLTGQLVIPKCSHCGRHLPAGRSDRVWCNDACRQAGYRTRIADRKKKRHGRSYRLRKKKASKRKMGR